LRYLKLSPGLSVRTEIRSRETSRLSRCKPTLKWVFEGPHCTTRTTQPLQHHSVVGWPVISSGNLSRNSTVDPTLRGNGVSSSTPLPERSIDSALCSGPSAPQSRSSKGIRKLWRCVKRRSRLTVPLFIIALLGSSVAPSWTGIYEFAGPVFALRHIRYQIVLYSVRR
jgi:hypothetical protein